uniref:Reverse transcriptase domain-containing protein n=1 Tax=Tanacetum cinerariifolium TaxID=118510 RepID=A0A6L2J2D5_TANCI|nr:hypothetical protein [Tanacetum cinerariifolium]
MTRSSTKELFTPFKDPKREFRSSKKLFKTLSLDESRSLAFDLFFDLEENSEEEVTETMAETMVWDEKIILKSVKPANSLIKRVYMLSLRERMKLDLEARLIGETLVLNRSLDPLYGDYIELNYLSVPLKLRRDRLDDLMPTIKEGEVVDKNMIEEVKTRDDNKMVSKIFRYPNKYEKDEKICIDYAYNLKFSCMIGFELVHANFFPNLPNNVMSKKFYNSIIKDKIEFRRRNKLGNFNNVLVFIGNFYVITDFTVVKDMDPYLDEGIKEVVVKEPFCEVLCMETRRFDGIITIHNEDDSNFRVTKSSTSLNNTSQISPVHAIAPVLPTKEPEYSFSIGYEHLSTTLETESDEVIKSSAKNLVPIPSEYEVTFDDENSSLKFDYIEEFSGELMPTTINSFPRSLENFHANTVVETLPISPIPVKDGDSHREEKHMFTSTDDLMPLGIESDDYDSEGDIHFLEELLVNDSIPLPKNESSYFDDHDEPSFPRPPPKPPDVEFFFDFQPNSRELILAVMNNIDELNEDECFDLGREIDVFTNVEDDDYFSFVFVIRIFLSYLTYPEVSPLLLFARSEDTIFDLGISI